MMDRTRGMSLSSEEREDLRKDELEKRAKGFRLKLLDNPGDAEQILASISGEPEQDRAFLQTSLWNEMVNGLAPGKDFLTHLEVMGKLPQGTAKASLLKELRSAMDSAKKDWSQDIKKVIAREKKKLASLGISGSAVVPKISKSGLDQDYTALIGRFKGRLLAGL